MSRPNSLWPLGKDFEPFLFAPVGEDKNGMLVSVLSVLARRDVDPWETADEMARLPVREAAKRLSNMIDVIPGGPLGEGPHHLTANQLIELLPHYGYAMPASPRAPPQGPEALATSKLALMTFLIALILMAVAQYAAQINPSAKAGDRATAQPESQSMAPGASMIGERGRKP
jgi:hypothetical protein